MDRHFTHRTGRACAARLPPRLGRWRGAALLAGAVVALAGPAAAQVPAEGTVFVTTLAEDHHHGGYPITLADPKAATLAQGSPTKVESFVQMDRSGDSGGTRFPTDTSSQPEGYFSALMSGNGTGAVGASGTKRGLPSGSAIATHVSRITHHGSAAATVPLAWRIPSIEVGVYAGDESAPFRPAEIDSQFSPRAAAQARLSYQRLGADGVLTEGGVVFDYWTELEKWRWDIDISHFQRQLSPDLAAIGNAAHFDTVIEFPFGYQRIASRVVYPEFSRSGSVAIAAGETLVFTYLMGAVVGEPNPVIDDIEMGLYAQVGDPFSIGPIGQGGFTMGALQPVPEPSRALLLACGGLGVMLWRRRSAGVASRTTGGWRQPQSGDGS